MVVIDTSALMALLLGEPARDAVMHSLEDAQALGMSAGTRVECAVVGRRRDLAAEMKALIDRLSPRIFAVDEVVARRIDAAYARWGAGRARLNFGDMFAYDLATWLDAPLLYVGEDFARTDVRSAL